MAESLAVKWRPHKFEDVSSQQSVIRILRRQLETQEVKNCYLFAGASGCGKTTLARIFADEINNHIGEPIEIDAASNNGVDNVKSIIKSAQERAIDTKYKIFIVDECHMITTQGWNAFLKCIEEPPTYTIFMFCTTDPQKIPATILNRVQRFNISKIPLDMVTNRLRFICEQEGYTNYEDGIQYISKISDGGMRDAIATLEKCASYDTDLSIENVLESLGSFSYDKFFKLVNSIIDGKDNEIIEIVDSFYNSGSDLKIFVDDFLNFCLDICKYAIFNNMDVVKLPSNMEETIKSSVNFDGAVGYYKYILNRLLTLKNMLKNDSNIRDTITVVFLQMSRCQ